MSELIRAATPVILAAIGAVIAIVALLIPDLSDAKFAAGMGLAASAVTGAAGLAQSSARDSKVSIEPNKIEAENNQVE